MPVCEFLEEVPDLTEPGVAVELGKATDVKMAGTHRSRVARGAPVIYLASPVCDLDQSPINDTKRRVRTEHVCRVPS